MKNIFNASLGLSAALLIVSCTTSVTPPTQKAAQPQNISAIQREQTLASIRNWNIHGAIAIRSPKENVTASLAWRQNQSNYTILLLGPFGAGSAKLMGSPHQIQLTTGDGKTAYANSPEQLLSKQLGWNLPISDLYYWVRGLPVPNTPAQKRFDSFNHLIALNQQGWNIQYLDYTPVNQIDVPSRIVMSYPSLNVKIVIKQWQF